MVTHKNDNFNKELFAEVLLKAIGRPDRSLGKFARQSGVTVSYISRFLNCKVANSPGMIIIQKLSIHAANGVTLNSLMEAAGYLPLNQDQKFNLLAQKISDWMQSNNLTDEDLLELFSTVQKLKKLFK